MNYQILRLPFLRKFFLVFAVFHFFSFSAFAQANCDCLPVVPDRTYTMSSNGNTVQLSNWLVSNGVSSDQLSGACIYLKDDLEIDIDIDISSSGFCCDPGTRIQISPARTVRFIDTKFNANLVENQKEMWHGIVTVFADLVMSNCKVSNALVGLYSNSISPPQSWDKNF